jgi:hypothetical protein
MGRPSDYTPEMADKICELLADGQSLRMICAAEDMPSTAAVCRWLGKHSEFREQYARAREAQADSLFDEILEIADNGENDWMERTGRSGESLGWVENGEALRRSQLRVEARKWIAGKLKPKKYGEKVLQEVSGPDGGPIAVERIERVIVDPKA